MRLGESVWNSVGQTVLNGYSQIPITLPVLKFHGLQGTHSKVETTKKCLVWQRVDEDNLVTQMWVTTPFSRSQNQNCETRNESGKMDLQILSLKQAQLVLGSWVSISFQCGFTSKILLVSLGKPEFLVVLCVGWHRE